MRNGLIALAAVALIGGTYLVTRALGGSGASSSGSIEESLALQLPSGDGQLTPWQRAEGGAFEDMIVGMDSLRELHAVEEIPVAWLSGPYLAEAGAFPEIRSYWTSYLNFLDAVRREDTVLFRRSYLGRLEEQDMEGPMVSIRLAQAVENFKRSQPVRDTVYDRMGDLASSALDLHELLVERAPDIMYDPVTETSPSRQPILEAWSEDEELRATIWNLLDRITANLGLLQMDAINDRSDLTERLFQELRSRAVGKK